MSNPVSTDNIAAMVGALEPRITSGGGVLLYEGNGKQSSITISQSAAGFSRLGICVRNNQNGNVESYVEVINPDGRTVGIALGTNQWSTPAVESITISGASLSVTSFGGTGAGFMFVIGYK